MLFIGAVGAVTRLIAPLIQGKERDPAVLVLDPKGWWVIPLLGGHSSGAEQRARELAGMLQASAVLTGACATEDRLALDAFGEGWGWRRAGSSTAWRQLMQQQACSERLTVAQTSGATDWQRQHPALESVTSANEAQLSIGAANQAPCRWHPASLWLGVGCERNTSLALVQRAIREVLAQAGLAEAAVAGLASIDRKADEPALLELSEQWQWPFRTYDATALGTVEVPTPSDVVLAEMGTASVAEAAALLVAGEGAVLRQNKVIRHAATGEQGAVTVAVAEAKLPFAPSRGELHLIGSGPGDLSLLSGDARQALARCTAWVGYGLYLDLLEPLRQVHQVRLDGQLTREWERCAQALSLAQQGARVALISSGDSGIYGMAGLALELWLQQPEQDRPSFQVHPGISALQLAAARVGAPLMHDFCTVSLSDRLTPWPVIEQRLRAAGSGDFVVALYNPRSKGRDWQLAKARDLLLEHRRGETPVLLARQLGRSDESQQLTDLSSLEPDQVDMLTVVLIGNSSSYARDGRIVTPRGYPGATLP
ncbi:bifunctional cobalt-precorrin-5A hydrolase / precorrin-3B C17-methyltransferase [Synechococcus sp. A15-24]|nr:bifunctional cobalt-precorrin-5A hydrolase / precorrin-3B C17-methyltransferase [Synechococcus sp. A15-24]